ncbi:MAG: nucleotidyltransferase domain-containing protein [Deltaproteobacteria bacterium]|nr:nucleotidyltransferase domain-containing protein [Deltaproteobacteria bacterium]
MVDAGAGDVVAAAVGEAFGGVAGVAAVYLYGSAARGRLRPDSDIDIGVVFGRGAPSGEERARVLAGVAALLGRRFHRAIDIVSLDTAPVVLRRQAIARGRRVLEPDRRASRAFAARALLDYWDLGPTLALFEHALDRRLGVRRQADGRP